MYSAVVRMESSLLIRAQHAFPAVRLPVSALDLRGGRSPGHVDPRRWCSHSTKILMLAMTLPNLPGRTFTSALLMWEVRWS